MKKNIWARAAVAVLLAFLLLESVALGEVDKLTISQIVQQGKEVLLYVNAQQSDGTPTADALRADEFSIRTDKGFGVTVDGMSRMGEQAGGVAYTFCVDVSGSVTNAEIGEICQSISSAISNMRDGDFARIITIGSKITPQCEFTQDRGALESAISQINNDDKKTFLYEGISYALDSMRKSIDGVPKRAAIIVFTDGMDDSDGTIAEDEILGSIAEVRVPLYVVGIKGNDKAANLSAVGRIARQSGGALYSYNDMSIAEQLKLIMDSVSNAYVFQVEPEESAYGQQNIVWKIDYSASGYTVSSANYVYSLSMDGVEFATPIPTESPTPAPTNSPTPVPEPTEAPSEGGEADESISLIEWARNFLKEKISFIISGLLVVAAVAIVLITVSKRVSARGRGSTVSATVARGGDEKPRKEQPNPASKDFLFNEDEQDKEMTVVAADAYYAGAEEEETIDGTGSSGVLLQLKIRFEDREEIIERRISDEIVLGRGEDCDVDVVLGSLSDIRRVTSRKHAAIINRLDGLFIRDLGSHNKTYVNGMEIQDEMPLKNGDIIKLGEATVQIKIIDY